MKPRLGCLTSTAIITVVLTMLIFGGITIARGGILFSPGGLNAQGTGQEIGGVRSHAGLADQCGACHPAPWDSEDMSDRCAACHVDVRQDPGNFHQALVELQAGCRDCHGEHQGADGIRTVIDLNRFPHDRLGYSLQGHQKYANGSAFACADCHVQKLSIFEESVCATCHRQMDASYIEKHTSAFGQGCLACHDGVDVYGKGKFDHSKAAFQLTGKHETVDCAKCHAGSQTPQELKAAPQDCFACHGEKDPHAGALGTACDTCHTPVDWHEITFDHNTSAFQLIGKHAAMGCAVCHQDLTFKNTPQDCYSCHGQDDPHQGQFGKDCAACHTPEDWDKVTFDHSKSSFPLTGQHSGVSCSSCHVNGKYKGTPTNCYACHAADDAHGGQYGTDCKACHNPNNWEAHFDHSGFPLNGAHAGLPCTACHPGGNFKGSSPACSACHDEPAYHAGMFSSSCGDCHSTNAWLPAPYNGAHTFPTQHGEGGNTCRTCHPSRLSQYTCYECHDQNEIRNKHEEEGIPNFINCMQCHPDGQEHEDRLSVSQRYSRLFTWIHKTWGGSW